MECKADNEVERDPRQIEQCNWSHAGQERPQTIEIAQRLQPIPAITGLERKPHEGIVNPFTDRSVEARANAHKDAAADQIKDAQARNTNLLQE